MKFGQPNDARRHELPRVRDRRGPVLVALFAVMLLAAIGRAEPTATDRFELWPGAAPTGEGRESNGQAYVTIYRPERPNGTCVVICPGGGYGGLAIEPEGHGIARWLNRHSITGLVLEYRMPHGDHVVPLLDAQRAIRLARSRAESLQCDPQRIGIIGFSAGGHLASTAATQFDVGDPTATDPIAQLSSRPDFAILVYPVITMGHQTHSGSRRNLLGEDPPRELVERYSGELHVTDTTPPVFLAHPRDDHVVPVDNSRMFHQAMRRQGRVSRYLELPWGDHGLNGYQGPTWDAWQTAALDWLAELSFIPADDTDTVLSSFHQNRLATWADMTASSHRVRTLPGADGFVFSLYGVPGEPAATRELLDVLRERKLANGFDPGPGATQQNRGLFRFFAANGWPVVLYSGGEMQIQGGRGVFGHEQAAILEPMSRIGVFHAYQLGEWGYYFHNLSHEERWWRDVFGDEYPVYQHLKKPPGLAGYDRMPTSKRECYDVLRDYFTSRKRDLLNQVISVTGHSHYESYAAEWGTECIGLELGENIAFTQSKLAFARGAARQWGKPWSVQVSPWFGPNVTTRGPLRKEGANMQGLDAGHSLSFYERMWLHSWFSGAAMVTPENSIAIFFETPASPWPMTPHGHKAAETFQLMKQRERGIPYTPIAIVLDHFAGYNGFMDKPWGILEPTAGDRELRDLFDYQLFPGSDHIHGPRNTANPEASYLRPTPFGEAFDVLLSSVTDQVLADYPVIVLAGDIEFDASFLGCLEGSLRKGSRVLISERHRDQLGDNFLRLRAQGTLEVLTPWINPDTSRTAAISNERLQQLVDELLPIEVTGDPIQYACNRTAQGWIVELINNEGVVKHGDRPAEIDAAAVAQVRLRPRVPCRTAVVWSDPIQPADPMVVELEIRPGGVEFVEFLDAQEEAHP